MTIILYIERLVLEGVRLTARERAVLQAAVKAELRQRLGEALPPGVAAGGAVDALIGGNVRLTPGAGARALGTEIGGAIHDAFAPTGGRVRGRQ
jgi:hypothetical protein